MNRLGKIITWGEPSTRISSASSPYACRIEVAYSGMRSSVVPNHPRGWPMRRNSGRRSFSVWPRPRSRDTASDLSV
jgi:hypothetical protein